MQNRKDEKIIYGRRIEKICRYLEKENIAAAVIEDKEGSRTANLRYLSGMPMDALLFIIPGKGAGREDKSILVPWDEILAGKIACADEIIGYTEFDRLFENAVSKLLEKEGIPAGSRVELPSALPHHSFVNFSGMEYLCRKTGFESNLAALRMVKDEEELAIIREGSRLTNRLLDELEMAVKKGEIHTEIDIALFIERRSRTLGCEGTGFETIAAGPDRSWGIHAFPLYTAGPFATKGMSLVDFGVNYKGYTTDITASFVKGPLSEKQEEMISLVEKAYTASSEMLAPGVTTMAVADKATDVFKKGGWVMPHALGHSYGLDVHEAPTLRNGKDPVVLEAGMVVTIEPGLYHEAEGGVRWENDFLITETGSECLTNSKIFHLID
ncbi:MAG: aminopeptidase P family protein [Spirochaetales bacterium]|nr:aminopeptidase P family protein [Spirochaetales bacterium]